MLVRLLVLSFSLFPALAYRWPSPRYEALEMLLFEGKRLDGSNLASIQHPCKRRANSQASIAAEWLRLAYHDTATHDAVEGTGGLDASIAFELDRHENLGQGMHDSLADFETFSNKYVSRADVIAIGVTQAIASCGGPVLSFRGGRVDAQSAGPAGVPLPEQDLETHQQLFSRQGFSKEEMITLVACGHTLGGVRSTDFPDIVPPAQPGSDPVFDLFDGTHVFDNGVVTGYLDGTTMNPLVVGRNSTTVSDLRIFSSDANVTAARLANPETFSTVCAAVLEKMLNSVPSSVQLTESIELLQAKVTNAVLTIENGTLVFKTTLRLAEQIGSRPDQLPKAALLWCDRYGASERCKSGQGHKALPANRRRDDPQSSPLALRLGLFFVHYDFVVPVDPAISLGLFWFSVEGSTVTPNQVDNDSTGYELPQDLLIYVPALSSVSFSIKNDTLKTYHIVAGLQSTFTPSRVKLVASDTAMLNYTTPLLITVDMQKNMSLSGIAGYEFYSGVVEDIGTQLTVDIHAEKEGSTLVTDFQQTFFLSTNIPHTPPTPVEDIHLNAPPTRPATPSSANALGYYPDIVILLLIFCTPSFLHLI